MLDGIWIPTGAEFSGQNIPLPESRWEITGSRYVVDSTESGRDEGDLRIDAAASPATIDLVGTVGPNARQTIRAIYRIRGDLLQLCYHVDGREDRPTAFSAEIGAMTLLVRYRRSA